MQRKFVCHTIASASLCMFSATSAAIEPCLTPIRPECQHVTTRIIASVGHTDFRPGFTTYNVVEGGGYGETITLAVGEGQGAFGVDAIGMASRSVETRADVGTLDGSLRASANSFADLSLGTMRGTISGYSQPIAPASFFEFSTAQVDMRLTDSILFHLPRGYIGGERVSFTLTVHGELGGDRFHGLPFLSNTTQVFASFSSTGSSEEFVRWFEPGEHLHVFQQSFELPAFGFDTVFPVSFNAFVRLIAGDSDGSFLIDMDNTASLTMDAPQGLHWESESGVFLSAVSPVPELPAPVYLGAGIGVLMLFAAQRRQIGRC